MKAEKSSPNQKRFLEKVTEIIVPTFEQFGFKKHQTEVTKHSLRLIYRKDNQYLGIVSNTHPRDYPNYYNIVLGEGNSDDFFEYDWNAVALWRFKKDIEPEAKASQYKFPTDTEVEASLTNANSELLKYALNFLNGELDLFYSIRNAQNKSREPYKIHSPNKSF